MPKTIGEMIRAVRDRCNAHGLKMQCGPDGAVGAEIAIIAEAPGETEITRGMPLVGSAGRVLWESLRKYKINRQQVYCTNVYKRQLLFDERKKSISADEEQHWQSLLRWELSQLPNLKYVLVLGGPALKALCDETGIMQWRGTVMPIELKHVETHVDRVPTVTRKSLTAVIAVNPAMCIREPKTEPVFRMDMHKLERVRNGTFQAT